MDGKLLYFSTTVEADKSVDEIRKILLAHGANSINVEYHKVRRVPIAIAFAIDGRTGVEGYRLDVAAEQVLAVLKSQQKPMKIRGSLVNLDQATRVGWRITRAWIDSQLALIAVRLRTWDQVFFADQLDGPRTRHEAYVQWKQLEQG